MIQLQPIRHSMIKKYFDKFKYQKKKRDLLFEVLLESEEQVAEILAPTGEFVPYQDAIPEIKQFLAEVEARELLSGGPKKETNAAQVAGASEEGGDDEVVDKEAQIEEVDFDPVSFNPFDKKSSKREEQAEAIKPNQPKKVLTVKK